MAIEQHLINLSAEGRLHASGSLHTPAAELPARLEAFAASGGRSLTLYVHGGLVNERAGLEQARALLPELSENAQSHPLFLLWESGLLETLQGALLEATQGSPLFTRVLRKLLKHAARALEGARAPGPPALALEAALPGTGIADAASLRADLEAERLPVDNPMALAALEPPPGATVDEVADEQVAALQADLAADPEASAALAQIVKAVRAAAPALESTPESAPGAAPSNAAPGFATGYLSGDLLRELAAQAPPPAVDGELISAAALWAFAGRILRAVIARYRAHTDHGLAGTVLEEIYRTMYADRVGAFLWEQLQHRARGAFDDLPTGSVSTGSALTDGVLTDDAPGGTLLLSLLRAHREQHGPFDLHLVGHSAGALLLCHLIERAAREWGDAFAVRTLVLLAPACSCELFQRTVIPHAGRIDTVRIVALEDELERRDPLLKWLPLAYPHSLLYLVSGLLEAAPDTALLGLARHVAGAALGASDSPAAGVRAWLRARPGTLLLSRTPADAPPGARAAFSAHSGENGPLRDRATLDSIATLLRPPPATNLRPLEVEVTPAIARVLNLPPEAPGPQPAGPQPGNGSTLFSFAPGEGPTILEAVIDKNDLIDHALIKGLLFAGRAVARLVVSGVEGLFAVPPDQRAESWRQAAEANALIRGHGTGWVLGRARRLLITNNHVLPLPEAARTATVEFGYERDLRTGAMPQLVLRLDPDAFFLTSPNMAFEGLDYTLVALSRPAPEEIGHLEPVQGITASTADNIFIVQHPGGNPKSYVLNHNRRVTVTDRYVTYVSDTLEGSSGSPLFDDSLRLVGIHHVGNFRTRVGAQEELTNLGSRIEVVLADALRQLQAQPGWDEAQVRAWFGDGPVVNLWRAMA